MVNAFDRTAFSVTIAVLAALYFVAGKLGLTLAFVNASATAVWPPAGIALARTIQFAFSSSAPARAVFFGGDDDVHGEIHPQRHPPADQSQ